MTEYKFQAEKRRKKLQHFRQLVQQLQSFFNPYTPHSSPSSWVVSVTNSPVCLLSPCSKMVLEEVENYLPSGVCNFVGDYLFLPKISTKKIRVTILSPWDVLQGVKDKTIVAGSPDFVSQTLQSSNIAFRFKRSWCDGTDNGGSESLSLSEDEKGIIRRGRLRTHLTFMNRKDKNYNEKDFYVGKTLLQFVDDVFCNTVPTLVSTPHIYMGATNSQHPLEYDISEDGLFGDYFPSNVTEPCAFHNIDFD